MDEQELLNLDAELRAIRLDDGPRLIPLRLDKMFLRARQWHAAHPPSHIPEPVQRPPTPPRQARVYPLPRPLPPSKGKSVVGAENENDDDVSPLSKLFEYPELVPSVLEHFDQPRDLAKICRVSREWCRIGRRKLYEHVWIRPWEDGCHFKLVLLFDTLHKHPELCSLIKRLDVRFFPLAARGEERSDLDDHVKRAMENMRNLRSLVWTRDRSLNPAFIETIADLDHLTSLEISGHSYRYYDPALLGTMPALRDLRIMMPDPNLKSHLVDVVKTLAQRPAGGLRGLGIICQTSSLIDDAIFKTIAPDLSKLKRLTLWGCSRVTRDGVFSILSEAADEVAELSLDALPHSGLLDLASSPSLPRLNTLSLSMTTPHKDASDPTIEPADLPTFPAFPSLTSLHLTLSAAHLFLPLESYQHLQAQLPPSLIKLSLINLVIASETVAHILTSNPHLEELYISVNHRNTVLDCEALAEHGQKLRILHVNAPEKWGPNSDDLLVLADRLKGLEQIGSGNRVYEVHRYLDGPLNHFTSHNTDEEGGREDIDRGGRDVGDHSRTELCRWTKPFIPGYFQVWRA
ncbi:hypothetical protein I316_04695 [Kwoniella heveanensis BCC8398]|uniref:F-box domain-containing protein n=1 Tax=Kwoniella heveanensis BCC8398 TaxID=1296120 RepID=A0A1B9GRF3_9TREE|nr:hypothetical protein I316_04695 [Kwoniella heveanensis BCC8398]